MSKVVRVKNISNSDKSYPGIILTPNQIETLTEVDVIRWRTSEAVVDDIESNFLQIGDADVFFDTHVQQVSHLFEDNQEKIQINSQPAFAAKTLPDGKRLFRRKHGFNITVDANGNNELVLTVPYAAAKINELELVNCLAGDKVDFMVYDSEQGLYQINVLGVSAEQVNSNLMLNQFGFGVYLPDGIYRDISKYDADVYGTMRLKIKYYNNSASQRTIYGNIVYHEVKE